MSQKHGSPLRGLLATRRSPSFEGKFGRMFRALRPAFDPHNESMLPFFNELGDAMTTISIRPRTVPTKRRAEFPRFTRTWVSLSITISPLIRPAACKRQTIRMLW